ncbi:hypothetical protein TNCV_2181611 [Trichonephila clavipes]|uniref:Uncharacterized protein n=1 Tax=Trichonephila clavipes TaxID=2585209 RepID=A0A8X6VUZ6_TRICX|nr:hypothetical protein TNCV_2181611 [Trichonephila clavipes]
MLNICVMHRYTGPARVLWYGAVLDITLVLLYYTLQINLAATPDQLWQRVEAAWSAVPQEPILSLFESMTRREAEVIPNNGGYSGY